MGYLRDLDQDNSIRRKAVQDQDEGGREPSASGWPHTLPPANPRLPLRQRSVHPPSDLPSTAGPEILQVPGRTAADISILPRDRNPIGHMKSSMGRLNVQDSEGLVRIPRRGAINPKTLEEHLERGSISSGSTSDGSIGSYSPLETRPPISIRSHIAAQIKAPDQDRNGMRVRRSQESGPPETSKKRDRKRTRRGDIGRISPTTLREMENSETPADRGEMVSHVRQHKKGQGFGWPPPGYADGLIHHHLPSLEA